MPQSVYPGREGRYLYKNATLELSNSYQLYGGYHEEAYRI
jgi:hypothetical protein